MDFTKLDRLAKDLAGKVSRFQIAELQEKGLRGEGPMSGLTRFEMAQVEELYEQKRRER
jgi:hypothetical protein